MFCISDSPLIARTGALKKCSSHSGMARPCGALHYNSSQGKPCLLNATRGGDWTLSLFEGHPPAFRSTRFFRGVDPRFCSRQALFLYASSCSINSIASPTLFVVELVWLSKLPHLYCQLYDKSTCRMNLAPQLQPALTVPYIVELLL